MTTTRRIYFFSDASLLFREDDYDSEGEKFQLFSTLENSLVFLFVWEGRPIRFLVLGRRFILSTAIVHRRRWKRFQEKFSFVSENSVPFLANE